MFYTPDKSRTVILTEISFLMHRMEHIQHSVIDSTFRRDVASPCLIYSYFPYTPCAVPLVAVIERGMLWLPWQPLLLGEVFAVGRGLRLQKQLSTGHVVQNSSTRWLMGKINVSVGVRMKTQVQKKDMVAYVNHATARHTERRSCDQSCVMCNRPC